MHHTLRIVGEVLDGREDAHEAGVIHQDLKPANILVEDRSGRALIADFGIARGPDDPTVTAEHTIMGTRPFVAPERLRGEDATVATDLFAVGVTLRFAATGH
ncbi:serine/threonine protein kinase, partial [Enterococcus hirae]